ncbi:hypothetical protein BVRB_002400 [Beta vulgaris subsp. vulgaris]|uniref:Uncharacterized protein n=1 Tax=Beta vulgaris subsp. vulgaris TaxID=3555 RepID=A0A0J8B545_BETVV|nr:hypothetical protein BVRB_002400 [Beta vulgaris subsp. vulgaris]
MLSEGRESDKFCLSNSSPIIKETSRIPLLIEIQLSL